jgi:DNA repair protein RecO (recombination protein O)
MLTTTNAIILNRTKYGENAIICSVYTLEFGKQSYIIKNSLYKKNKAIYLHPLQIIEFEVDIKEGKTLFPVKNASSTYTFREIPFDVYKSTISVFISQLLNSLIKEESVNEDLYMYIKNSCIYLDTIEKDFANFHLFFMIRLSQHLGYFPNDNYSEKKPFFNLKKGRFTDIQAENCAGPNISKILYQLIKIKIDSLDSLKLSHSSRNIILDTLVHYFELHNDKRLSLKSLPVIREIFS